jgi:hypothetical protein
MDLGVDDDATLRSVTARGDESRDLARPMSANRCARCLPRSVARYVSIMNALEAHVVNGQIVLDEPAVLPEGAELHVYLYNADGDSLSDAEREALHRSIRRGVAQADKGELIDADEVLGELERAAVHE